MEQMDELISDGTSSASLEQTNNFSHNEKKAADLPLDAAIQRGEVLRKKKRLCFQKAKTSLHVLDDEVCSTKKYRNGCRPRKPLRNQQPICDAKTCFTFKPPSCPQSREGIIRSNSPSFVTRPTCSKAYTTVSLKNRRRPLKCPLRIAELAEPTKRHCIETWRYRNETLPSHMLERLKQNVMNLKVVATIPDAVNCFKVHKNTGASSTKRSNNNRCRSPRVKSKKESQEMADVRLMSAVFAHRVAAKLVKPMNLYLPEELLKVSNVVSEEITQLIQNRRVCADYVYNQGLLKEMSGKITLWISDVLACAQYKLLEDELRVLKTQENKMGKDGNLVTLIDQYVRWQMEEDQDLEEEEGPALDAIETLVDNVLDICLPKTDSSSFDYESHPAENDLQNLSRDDDNKAQNEDFDNEDRDSQLSGNNLTKDQNETDTPNNIPDVTGVYDMPEHLIKEVSDDESESKYDSTGDLNSNVSVAGETHDEGNIKVSDVNVTLEDPLDDRKKVKFTRNEGGNRESGGIREFGGNGKSGGLGSNSNSRAGSNDNGRVISNESLEKWPNYSLSATLIRSDIVFQPPNPSILSVVDESWPDDFMSPTLKPSESVSKSITSLGEIKEVDDEIDLLDDHFKRHSNAMKERKYLGTFNKYGKHNKERMSPLGLFEQDDENSFIDFNFKDKQSDRQTALEILERDEGNSFVVTTTTSGTISSNVQKDKEDSNTVESQRMQTDSNENVFFKVTPSKLLSDLQALITEQAEQIKQEKYIAEAESFNDDGKGDHNDTQKANQDDTDTEKSPIVQAIKEKLRNETKFDYRVRPQTAPAWALTSPSDDSMTITRKKMRLGTCELRKWCKDLENTLINLDQWNKWINVTCKKVEFMQNKTAANTKLGPQSRMRLLKEWTKLKKSIDKDALLWKKLNQRTFEVLKSYPSRSKPASRCKSATQKQKVVNKESMCNAIFDIEGMSACLHRSIVSTEHVIKCNCRAFIVKPQSAQSTKKLRKN